MVMFKSTVRLKRLTPALLTMLNALYAADLEKLVGQPEDLVITSGNDSTHAANSRHYTDEALDVRSKTFINEATKEQFRVTLEANLGPQFRVLHESNGTPNEHYHIQVKKGQTFP